MFKVRHRNALFKRSKFYIILSINQQKKAERCTPCVLCDAKYRSGLDVCCWCESCRGKINIEFFFISL